MRSLDTAFVACALAVAMTAAQPGAPVPRPAVVAPLDAPVVIEETRGAPGRLHAHVRLRNVTDRAVVGVTVRATVGVAPPLPTSSVQGADRPTVAPTVPGPAAPIDLPPGEVSPTPVLRRAERIDRDIAPHAAVEIDLAGVSAAALQSLFPTGPDPVAELGVIEVRFASGTVWRARSVPTWLGRPDVGGRGACLDDTWQVHQPGDTVMIDGTARLCQVDGTTSVR